jgi:glycosyltransferase involved in cell wall biosynthesis
MPRVSVLMPVRNEAGRVARALASLRRQTLPDWECVVIDDGSDDDTASVVRASADARVRLVEGPPRGIVAALNQGLALCRGSMVARMDADDVAHPRRLERQIALLDERPELGAVGCGVRLFPRRGLRGGMLAYEAWLNGLSSPADIARDMYVECPIAHPSLTVRADVLRSVGGYREQGWAEDYDLILRLHERGVRFAKAAGPLLFWCDRPDRLSRVDPRCSFESLARCKIAALRPRLGETVVLRGAGPTGRRMLAVLLSEGLRVAAIVDVFPPRLGQRIAGIPIVRADHPAARGWPLLVAVGVPGARAQIRAELCGGPSRAVEGRDFWMLA